jgi:hypothetical protein
MVYSLSQHKLTNTGNVNAMTLSPFAIRSCATIFSEHSLRIRRNSRGSTNDWNNNNWHTTRGTGGPTSNGRMSIQYHCTTVHGERSGMQWARLLRVANSSGGDFALLSLSRISIECHHLRINDDFSGSAPTPVRLKLPLLILQRFYPACARSQPDDGCQRELHG